MIYVQFDSTDAAFAFALEQYLLREKDLGSETFLFWRTRPTLMLGCYQNAAAEINERAARERGVAIVRRVTGGGTIYTDMGGWQFSFISREGAHGGIDFHAFMSPVVRALGELGVPAEFSSRNDILIGGRKVSGNAQYRGAGCTLHHGSLLYDTDLDAMVDLLTPPGDKLAAKGVKSVRQRVTNIAEHLPVKLSSTDFRDRMLESLLCNAEGIYHLTPEDTARVEEIAQGRFRRWEWNIGQSPCYERVRTARFAGGRVEVRLNVNRGRITACSVSGDFFAAGDIGALESALVGCPCREEDVRRALERVNADELIHQVSLDELYSLII